jgi:hypothetical protein
VVVAVEAVRIAMAGQAMEVRAVRITLVVPGGRGTAPRVPISRCRCGIGLETFRAAQSHGANPP